MLSRDMSPREPPLPPRQQRWLRWNYRRGVPQHVTLRRCRAHIVHHATPRSATVAFLSAATIISVGGWRGAHTVRCDADQHRRPDMRVKRREQMVQRVIAANARQRHDAPIRHAAALRRLRATPFLRQRRRSRHASSRYTSAKMLRAKTASATTSCCLSTEVHDVDIPSSCAHALPCHVLDAPYIPPASAMFI